MQPGSANVITPRHSDADRPVARILPAVVIVNSNKYKSSSSVSSTESFRSLKDESALTSPDHANEDVRVFHCLHVTVTFHFFHTVCIFSIHVLPACFCVLSRVPSLEQVFLQRKCRS